MVSIAAGSSTSFETPKLWALAITGIIIICLWYTANFLRDDHSLALSPPGIFLLGNLLDCAKAAQNGRLHLLQQEWARKYEEIVRVRLGPVTEYYINSDIAVKVSRPQLPNRFSVTHRLYFWQELFDKSSARTAERPRWIVSRNKFAVKECSAAKVYLSFVAAMVCIAYPEYFEPQNQSLLETKS